MLKILNFLILSLVLLFACQPENSNQEDQGETLKPNVVYILADDLGYGDIGVYGQQKIRTPHLDKMAAQGMRFTQHYSGSTVCAPSRSSLMTGLHTGHTPVRGNREIKPEGQYPLADSVFTLAEMFQKAGYVTGAFGKWGLGYPASEGDPNNQGFQQFFGYNCQRLAHNYYPEYLWDNQQKIEQTGNQERGTGDYGADVIHQQALQFIENNKDSAFFLFLPYIIPHAELLVPEDSILESYRGKFPETPYQGVDDGESYRKGGYGSQAEPHAVFAAMVTRLDLQVGQILQKLEELGLAENTLVMFSSDNGPHVEGGADPDFFDSNGPLRGYKRDLYEGGIRVPMIAWWPGKVQEGSSTDHVSAFWDVFPTLSELIGTDVSADTDGISFLPTLIQNGEQPQHDYLYWEFTEKGGRVAARKGKWKGVRYNASENPNGSLELYNLEQDVSEENNIAADHPEIVEEMNRIIEQAHRQNPVFTLYQQESRS
jgi:arylsulfatase A-like enzyme